MKKSLLRITYLLCAVSLLCELGIRLAGFKPYQPISFQANQIRIQPYPVFQPDSTLGYALKPGTYRFYYPDSTFWTATIDQNHHRITTHKPISAKQSIYILGCSFTFGSGLEDSSTFPYLLQQNTNTYRVLNLGVGGYGIAQAYLELQKLPLDSNDKVVYAFIGEHHQRYTQQAFKKLLPSKAELQPYQFVQLNENLQPVYFKFNYHPLPLISYSAFLNLIDDQWIIHLDKTKLNKTIAQKALVEMNQLCRKKGVQFVFMTLQKDQEIMEMGKFCMANQIPFLDASLDLNLAEYNLQPYDDHPNAKANRYYKNKLYDLIFPPSPNED
ncbi:MAG: SGNH/GDSL hydrolase family protein [Bacteroidia bacterium]|nr:SGNH/GDSL hydrolase family protein [Bacteroidia bacterium]